MTLTMTADWHPASQDYTITEVAAGFACVRDTFGGATIVYDGGGGQGNHLCGAEYHKHVPARLEPLPAP